MAWVSDGAGGERKIRIDGLTYGGFKLEDDEPAENLMRALKAKFSGEIIDYEAEEEESRRLLQMMPQNPENDVFSGLPRSRFIA